MSQSRLRQQQQQPQSGRPPMSPFGGVAGPSTTLGTAYFPGNFPTGDPTGGYSSVTNIGSSGIDDDVYSGFDTKPVAPLAPPTETVSSGFRTSAGRPLQTAGGGFTGIQSRMGAPASRLGMTAAAGGGDAARPMTSIRAAGYSTRGRATGFNTGPAFDPFNQAGRYAGGEPGGKPEQTPEEQIKALERRVNALIEESAFAAEAGDHQLALEKAKEAGKKERQLTKQREQASLGDQINLDLTYCVLFNLANQYHTSRMYQEALNTYSVIVKNKLFTQSGRLRVNMGNIYFEQGKYSQAIKMYRMALDQIPNSNGDVRLRIMRNIGSAFVKMGQFQDAITSYETIMEASPDVLTGFNLVLCYFALGDREKMKKEFLKLVATRPFPIETNEWEEPSVSSRKSGQKYGSEASEFTVWGSALSGSIGPGNASGWGGGFSGMDDDNVDDLEVFHEDSLRALARHHRKAAERYIILAAKLIAPAIEPSFALGYDWVTNAIKASPAAEIASELEIAKAIQFLKTKQFADAIETLKSFEKKDQKLVGTAATNLSFLYFLEGEHKQAEKYADVAIQADRYNAKALTNRGNLHYVKGNFHKAREYYLEAISVDASCTEAMYNLGLVYKSEDAYDDALACFEKLHAILRNHAEVIFQLADICDKMDNLSQAMEWFNILISVVPTDPAVLAKMGETFLRDGDKSQAFQYYSESYRYFPSNMDVIAWLGAYYVDCAVYEQAIQFFERAAMIEPKEVRWPLMVASCHRRSGNYQMAYEVYKRTHESFPNDVECLRFLVRICTDLGVKDVAEYQARLTKAENTLLETRVSSRNDSGTAAGAGGGTTNASAPSSSLMRSANLLQYQTHQGSAGSGASGRARKAVKFDLGEAKATPAFTRAASAKSSRGEEDWQDDVDNLLPD